MMLSTAWMGAQEVASVGINWANSAIGNSDGSSDKYRVKRIAIVGDSIAGLAVATAIKTAASSREKHIDWLGGGPLEGVEEVVVYSQSESGALGVSNELPAGGPVMLSSGASILSAWGMGSDLSEISTKVNRMVVSDVDGNITAEVDVSGCDTINSDLWSGKTGIHTGGEPLSTKEKFKRELASRRAQASGKKCSDEGGIRAVSWGALRNLLAEKCFGVGPAQHASDVNAESKEDHSTGRSHIDTTDEDDWKIRGKGLRSWFGNDEPKSKRKSTGLRLLNERGFRIDSLRETSSGVILSYADSSGSDTRSVDSAPFDLVIGADGPSSVCRKFTQKGDMSIIGSAFDTLATAANGLSRTGFRVAYAVTPAPHTTTYAELLSENSPDSKEKKQQKSSDVDCNGLKLSVKSGEIHRWCGDGADVLAMRIGGGDSGGHYAFVAVYRDKLISDGSMISRGTSGIKSGSWEKGKLKGKGGHIANELRDRLLAAGFSKDHDVQKLLDAATQPGGWITEAAANDHIAPRASWSSTSGKVMLVGDSAHTIAPIIGGGVNEALADAACLCRLLAASNSGRDFPKPTTSLSGGGWSTIRSTIGSDIGRLSSADLSNLPPAMTSMLNSALSAVPLNSSGWRDLTKNIQKRGSFSRSNVNLGVFGWLFSLIAAITVTITVFMFNRLFCSVSKRFLPSPLQRMAIEYERRRKFPAAVTAWTTRAIGTTEILGTPAGTAVKRLIIGTLHRTGAADTILRHSRLPSV